MSSVTSPDSPGISPWTQSHKYDRRALPLADRHYNRRKPGTPQFCPPGRTLVLLTPAADALWVTSWPYAELAWHEWAGAWVCSLFRNEGPQLSSDLIRAAVAATCWRWPVPDRAYPFVSFINVKKVRPKRHPGYCYLMAGWEQIGMTKKGLHVVGLSRHRLGLPQPPAGTQIDLT